MDIHIPTSEYFVVKFEGIEIHFYEIMVEIIHDVNPEMFLLKNPYSGIWHDISVNGLPDFKNMVGKVFIIFKDQKDLNTALWLEAKLVLRASATTKAANNFCKLIQYLFKWVTEYVKTNEINNSEDHPFLVPDFGYSDSYFEYAFPQ